MGAGRAPAIERYYDAILVYGPASSPDAIRWWAGPTSRSRCITLATWAGR